MSGSEANEKTTVMSNTKKIDHQVNNKVCQTDLNHVSFLTRLFRFPPDMNNYSLRLCVWSCYTQVRDLPDGIYFGSIHETQSCVWENTGYMYSTSSIRRMIESIQVSMNEQSGLIAKFSAVDIYF